MKAQSLLLAPALYLAHAHYRALSLWQALALVLALWLAQWLAHTQSQCLHRSLHICLHETGTPGEGRGVEKAISCGRSPVPPFTRYDLPFRFERALQPDALRVVATCTIAVNDAIADATNAGLDPERDPAVLLLARHLGRVAAGQDPEAMHDEDRDLRTLCQSRIAALRSADVLIPLVRRGFAHDAHLTKVYRSAARDRLRAVAHALDLEAADYELRARSDQGPVPILDLQADYFRVTIAPERLMPGREVRWLRTASSRGGWEGSATTGEIGVLADIGQFARALRRTLHLPVAVQPVLL